MCCQLNICKYNRLLHVYMCLVSFLNHNQGIIWWTYGCLNPGVFFSRFYTKKIHFFCLSFFLSSMPAIFLELFETFYRSQMHLFVSNPCTTSGIKNKCPPGIAFWKKKISCSFFVLFLILRALGESFQYMCNF